MKYRSSAAFRMAMERHLAGESQTSGLSIQRLRKAVTFDRYLARLQDVAPNAFTLKGGVALDYRLDQRGRATKDIDMVRLDGEERALADLQRAARTSLDDYFEFELTRTSLGAMGLLEGAHVGRFRLRSEVAGRLFEEVLLDLSLSGPLLGSPDTLHGPDLLSFAGIPPTEFRAIAIEQHLAEKLHAQTREYASGRSSSRSKDLVDILLIISSFEFEAARIRDAIRAVFEARSDHQLPSTLPEPPSDWISRYAALAREVGVVEDVKIAHKRAVSFFQPLLNDVPVGTWHPALQRWK